MSGRVDDNSIRGDAAALIADLTDEQRDAVTTSASPLCIIAGAGSGKTRVLTRRIAWQAATGNIDPRHVLALTFTRRAAGELRRRTRSLGLRDQVAAGTFHGVALAILRSHWESKGRKPPELLQRRMAFVAKANPKLDRAVVADLDAEIGWSRARMVTPERYVQAAADAKRRPPRSPSFTADIYAAYNEAKRKRRLIDFDDILALAHDAMTNDKSFAAAQHWRHRHLLVDEFQDVNPLQFAVLQSWLGPESTLLVVGDPNQAIYGWNGAEPDLLRNIDQHISGIAVLHLRTNFRSSPEILAAASRVLDEPAQPSARPPGDEPTIRELEGDDEAVAIARAVRGRHRPGAPWRHQAVLARTNAQLPPLRSALEAAGIPTRSRSEGALLRRPEIMDLLDDWHGNRPLKMAIADSTEIDPDLSAERAAMVEAFLELAHDHLALEKNATVDDFLTSLRADDRGNAANDGVELTTFHGAKGLEWPIVHLVGLEDGLVPIAFASNRAAFQEEQRLLYVAATRAERELHVSWCRHRAIGKKVLARPPSPWLSAFIAEAPALPDDRPSFANIRAKIAAHADVDMAKPDALQRQLVFDGIVQWREQQAEKARTAPTGILSDRILHLLAAERPCSIEELAEIEGIGSVYARRFGLKILEITCLDEK